MNHRISNEYLSGDGGKNAHPPSSGLGLQQLRSRGQSFAIKDTVVENLDLFSRNRRIFTSSDDSDATVSMKLGRLSVASVKLARSGMDELLNSGEDGGKHDYDWLITPPGTPLVSSTDASEPQSATAGARNSASVRSVSTTKASRLSLTQSENSYSSRPTRSSSATRPSIATANYTSYSVNRSSSSILNTSSQSVTSISRPSTPSSRSSLPSATRPSTPTARPSNPTARPSTPGARVSRPSTPSKSRPTTTTTSGDKARTLQNARPSTPTPRPLNTANSHSLTARSNSRPSTPTRRNPAPGPPQVRVRSASVGPPLTNGRSISVAARGSSPGPRARSMQQPVVPPDYPLDTPPNLRTTLPDRPVSAGRSRPGVGLTVKGKTESQGPVNPPRKQSSSPVTTRGRIPEPSAKGRSHVNGNHHVNAAENQKMSPNSDAAGRRPSKPATSTDSTGFGRTISKKSLDMALRHMDIRNGSTGSIRTLAGTSLFPQSVRSGMPKGGGQQRGGRVSDSHPPRSTSSSKSRTPAHSSAPSISDNGSGCCIETRFQDDETEEVDSCFIGKVSEPDIYESSRYDTILLKEDVKNTNWLHSIDDKSDIFDQPFEPLPEPFDPL